jgi:hypothetical protein
MMQPSPSSSTMRYDRPRFRQDLLAELVDEQGARFVDVMDPDSGNLFRFYEVEYSLACAMDGERDVPGIVKWAQEELGLTPSPQEVRTVIATLGDLGFIDTGAAELAPGVVVGAPGRPQPSTPIELGRPGMAAPGSGAAPRASEYSLGAAGSAWRPAAPAEPAGREDVELGAPGRTARPTPSPPASAGSDLSLDLSDHIAVRPADVQEAVRASKVMSAVEVPQSLLDTIEDRPTAKAAQPAHERGPEARPEAPRPESRDARDARDARPESRDARDAKPEARVGKPPLTRQSSPTRPPVELQRPPAAVEQPVPTAPQARVSPVLIVLLILVALGAGAYLVWKYVVDKPSTPVSMPVEPAAPPVVPAPPPVPPPPPTAKVAMEVPEPDDVKAGRAGVIETILADKSAVKSGDVLIKLVGNKPIEAELFNIARDQKRLQDQIDTFTRRRDAARAAGNRAAENAAQNGIDDRQKALDAKQALAGTKTADLDKFLIQAPSNGTFSPAVKQGQKVAVDDVLATIQRDAVPVATFQVGDLAPFASQKSVELAVGKGELRVTCAIVADQSTGDALKVMCPVDPALTAGTDVTLKLPAVPSEPAARGSETGSPTTPATAPEVPGGPATPPGAEPAAPPPGAAPGSAATPSSEPAPAPATPEPPKSPQ